MSSALFYFVICVVCGQICTSHAGTSGIEFVPKEREVPAGSSIYCFAEGDSNAKVTMKACKAINWSWYCGPGPWSKLAEGSGSAEFRAPLSWSGSWYKFKCTAEYSKGRKVVLEHFYYFTGPKLEARLIVRNLPLRVGTPANISCSASGPNVTRTSLHVSRWRLEVRRTADPPLRDIWKNGKHLKNVSDDERFLLMPGVTLEKYGGGRRIDVRLEPRPSFHGVEVFCKGASSIPGIPKAEDKKTLNVTWPASVRRPTVSEASGDTGPAGRAPNAVAENLKAIVRCAVQLGQPLSKKSALEARIGNRILENPTFSRPSSDADGFLWMNASWKTSMSRRDDGKAVECRIGANVSRSNVRVLYRPQASDITLRAPGSPLTVGDVIICAAAVEAEVELRLLSGTGSELLRNASNRSAARLTISTDTPGGNFTALCSADNGIGRAQKRSDVYVWPFGREVLLRLDKLLRLLSPEEGEEVLPGRLTSLKEFKNFEGRLAENKVFQRDMVAWLKPLASFNLRDSARRMMFNIATRSLWAQFGLKGGNDKESFVRTLTYKMMRKAVKKIHPNFRDASDADFDEEISALLKEME